jgi:hypothetical protein
MRRDKIKVIVNARMNALKQLMQTRKQQELSDELKNLIY